MQERIEKNSKYFRSIEMLGGHPILRVCYPDKWSVFPSIDESIKVTRSDTAPNEWFYYSTDENVTLNDMFNLMEQTVEVNLSAIAKIELLKVKMEELKAVFGAETLDRLQRLKFVIEDDEQPKQTKKNRKKKQEQKKVESKPQEEEYVMIEERTDGL